MFKRTLSPVFLLALSVALSQPSCTAESTDEGAEDALSDEYDMNMEEEENLAEGESALSGDNLTWANACVSKIKNLRTSIGLAAGTNIVQAATKEPAYSGATYGDCARKEAKYDSTNGGHAAHKANLYKCLGTQNECVNWKPNAGETPTQMVKRCVQGWFDEGPGADYSKHGHYTNMTSSTYKNITCGVYKNASGQYTIAADFKASY
ncbi:MAG: CAP domain-containing protein [Polyangiaceae bacterium]